MFKQSRIKYSLGIRRFSIVISLASIIIYANVNYIKNRRISIYKIREMGGVIAFRDTHRNFNCLSSHDLQRTLLFLIFGLEELKAVQSIVIQGQNGGDIRGKMSMLRYLSEIKSVSLRDVIIDNSVLVDLGRLERLEELSIAANEEYRPNIIFNNRTNTFCKLKKLQITNIHISNFNFLSGMEELEVLLISRTGPGEIDKKNLKPLSNLKEIYFIDMQMLTDDNIKFLLKSNAIKSLVISNCPYINGNCLANLTPISSQRLRSLILSNIKFCDANSYLIKKFPSLERLLLTHLKISDKSLKNLENFNNLKLLDLTDTQITIPGAKKLKEHYYSQGKSISIEIYASKF